MTAKISEVIKILKDMKSVLGDVNVYISRDSEGNEFGTINKDHSLDWDKQRKFIIFYPYEEILDCDLK